AAARTSVTVVSEIVELFGLTSTAKSCGSRQQFVQEPKLLSRKLKVHGGDAGDVTAWLVEASDETSPDRVAADLEDDRNCRGRSLGRKRTWCIGRRGDDSNSALNQFGGQFGQPFKLILGPAVFDRDVPTFNEPDFAQTLSEREHQIRRIVA